MKFKFAMLPCVFALAMTSVAPVFADALPSNIRIVVGNPPGGGLDILARLLATGLNQETGSNVVVENVPGAGNVIALARVASSSPDGTTLLLGSSNDVVVDVVHKTDNLAGLAPLGTVASVPYVLIGYNGLEAKTTDELVDYANLPDNEVTVGANGVGTALHLTAELFQIESQTQMTYVPYKGASQTIADLMGGHIDLCVTVLSSALQHIENGTVKGYGVFSPDRSPFAPDLPSLSESKAMENMRPFSNLWMGAFAPVDTPPEIRQAISDSIGKVMQQPEFRKKVEETGSMPVHLTADELAETIQTDRENFQTIIATADLKLE